MCVYRYDTCERGSMSTHMLSIEEVISEGITLTITMGIDIYIYIYIYIVLTSSMETLIYLIEQSVPDSKAIRTVLANTCDQIPRQAIEHENSPS